MRQISFWLDAELYGRIKRQLQCEGKGRTLSALIRGLLMNWLCRQITEP